MHLIEVPVKEDFEELTLVWEASVRATHTFLKEEDIQFFRPLILNSYLDAVQLYCVRGTNNAIEGFIGISDRSVEMLFIHPSARGRGTGKALLRHVIEKHKCTCVDVNEQNAQAVGFYEKQGFKVTGRSATDGMGKPYPILHMELVEDD